MIRVLVYHGENMDNQLAEIQIERTDLPPILGIQEYAAQIVVDNVDEVHAFSIKFSHDRDSENVLGMLDSLLEEIAEIDSDKMLIHGKLPDRAGWHENFKDIIRELRGR
jgi:hypothetical protein